LEQKNRPTERLDVGPRRRTFRPCGVTVESKPAGGWGSWCVSIHRWSSWMKTHSSVQFDGWWKSHPILDVLEFVALDLDFMHKNHVRGILDQMSKSLQKIWTLQSPKGCQGLTSQSICGALVNYWKDNISDTKCFSHKVNIRVPINPTTWATIGEKFMCNKINVILGSLHHFLAVFWRVVIFFDGGHNLYFYSNLKFLKFPKLNILSWTHKFLVYAHGLLIF